jgi:hypothetical protein
VINGCLNKWLDVMRVPQGRVELRQLYGLAPLCVVINRGE